MKLAYNRIRQQYSIEEAAYQYLSDTYGAHVPHIFTDLIEHLIRCIQRGASEAQFKRDAKTMYNV